MIFCHLIISCISTFFNSFCGVICCERLWPNQRAIFRCGVKNCYIAVCKGIPNETEGMIEGMIKKAHWNYKRFTVYPHKGNKYVTDAAKVDPFDIADHQYVDNKTDGKKGGQHIKTVMLFDIVIFVIFDI